MEILQKLQLVLFSATATSTVPDAGFSICPAPRERQCRAEPPAAPQWSERELVQACRCSIVWLILTVASPHGYRLDGPPSGAQRCCQTGEEEVRAALYLVYFVLYCVSSD